MYEDPNGNVYNYAVSDTDARSKWQVIPASVTLSDQENELQENIINKCRSIGYGVYFLGQRINRWWSNYP